MLLDATQAQAQAIFDTLPAALRWPTLSPDYVAADAFRDKSLQPLFKVARQGDGILMHAVHESLIPGMDACDWQSPYGYGGPVALAMDEVGLSKAWQQIDELAAARRVVAEFVRFHPGLDKTFCYPGHVRADRAVVLLDLQVDRLLDSYSGRARTAVRKAERAGLRAVWETRADALAHFPAFYRTSMTQIGAGEFYMFGDDYFGALLALPSARVLSVLLNEERISMGLFLFGPSQVEYHLSGTLPAGRDAGATNLLLHTAALEAQATGRQSLYLGGGTSARPDDPLLRFKSSFAPARHTFQIGHRILDARQYEQLRATHPALAASRPGRVLFYRK
jgi:hypothetical protein